jgi:tRNA-2-methylthio-N6-dimethylallyladenosine synthase
LATIYIETFGCQMNEADSDFIADRAASAGYALAKRPEDASVLVLNTCTVRDNAERRAYGRINQLKALKAADPAVKLVVCGCLAEQDKDRMQTIVPHVDAVFGTKELSALSETIARWRPSFRDGEETEERALLMPLGGAADCVEDEYAKLRSFVTVQRGCSYYCTFCIVPHVRGRFDHRPMPEIVADVRARVAAGAREITLVGQTVNAYRDPATEADFADLLEAVAEIEGVERLTFITSHPKDFNEKLARTLGAIDKLNPRLHLAVQSGSNPVLRRMNRKYTIEQYLEKVAMLREYCPDWALTTDLIVGFPGETEEDFERTLELCARNIFAQAFMFVYSPRRGTPASHWEQIPAEAGAARLQRLIEVQDRSVRAHHERKVGTTVRALVHGFSRKDREKLSLKTLDNVTVVTPNVAPFDAASGASEPWIDVRIDFAFTWGAMGTPLRRAPAFDDPGRPVEGPVLSLL